MVLQQLNKFFRILNYTSQQFRQISALQIPVTFTKYRYLPLLYTLQTAISSRRLQPGPSLELRIVQFRIKSASGQQLIVIPLLHNIPVLHDQNHIRVPDGG